MLPSIFSEEDILNFELQEQTQREPLKTYKMDIETGEILPIFIDGNEAICQHIVKAIKTNRLSYSIYTHYYGSELRELVGKSFSDEYIKLEVRRLVEECLVDYDRVTSIEDLKVIRDNDSIYIELTVLTDLSESLTVEVTI